jgi:drug/metabolite transporter (DMT)-like permease
MQFYLYSLLGAFGLGLMPLFKKLAIVAGTDTVIVAHTSSLIAAVVALTVVKAGGGYELKRLFAGVNLPRIALIGALGSGVVVLLNIEAMQVTTATNRSLFQAMYPAATILFAWAMLGERLRWIHYPLILVMAVGLFLMNSAETGLQLNRGFWLLVLTLPLIGFCDAYAKKHLTHIPPPLMATGRILFGLVLLTVALVSVSLQDWHGLAASWYWVLLGGLFNAIGLFAFYRAMALRQVGLAAAFVSLAPAVTALGEWATLGTVFAWYQLLGMLLVLLGAVSLAFES